MFPFFSFAFPLQILTVPMRYGIKGSASRLSRSLGTLNSFMNGLVGSGTFVPKALTNPFEGEPSSERRRNERVSFSPRVLAQGER